MNIPCGTTSATAGVNFADLDGDNEVDETEILQQNHYYPFGMNIENPAWSGTNGYQYNGKELNTDFGLDWNDYGARWYDAGLGRFTTVDPLASIMPGWSPYSYTFNNPIAFTDPLGLAPSTSLWGDDIGSEKREEGQERMRIANDKVENKGKDKVVIDKNGDKRNVSKSDIEFTVNFQEEENGPVDVRKSSNPVEDIIRRALTLKDKEGLDFYDIIKRGYTRGHSGGATYYNEEHMIGMKKFQLYIVGEKQIDTESSLVWSIGMVDDFNEKYKNPPAHLLYLTKKNGEGKRFQRGHSGFHIEGSRTYGRQPLLTITGKSLNAKLYLHILHFKYTNKFK